MKVLRDARLWGASALAAVTALGVVAAMVYIAPPGDKIVTYYTDDASSMSPGMSVRIAGIAVGKIKDLAIEPDRVRVRATVEGNAFVGVQSSVEVRMLTVVGGYFVNIDSLGDEPLGNSAIPMERVTLPYSLTRALADTTKLTDRVQPAPIKASLDQIQEGMAGSNVNTLSAVVDAGTTLTETLDRQQGQVTKILNLSDEWIKELANYREQFASTIEQISILEATLVLYGKGFTAALEGLGKVVEALGPVGDFYQNHRSEFLRKVIHWQQIVRTWADRSGLVVRILQRTRGRMEATLDRQNAPPELLATDLCIPLPGSPC